MRWFGDNEGMSRRALVLGCCVTVAACRGSSMGGAADAALGDAAQDQAAEMPAPDVGSADAGADADPGCSPGTVFPSFGGECANGRCICRTYAPDGGTLIPLMGTNMRTDVISYLLPQPMRAGQAYTFSAGLSVSNFTGNLEIWGSNAECGPGLERLFSEPFASKVYCVQVNPTQDYDYVLIVEQFTGRNGSTAALSRYDTRACPAGSCP
jgi:hypothetical protein